MLGGSLQLRAPRAIRGDREEGAAVCVWAREGIADLTASS